MSSRFAEYGFSDLRSRAGPGAQLIAIAVPGFFRAKEIKVLADAKHGQAFEPLPKRREFPGNPQISVYLTLSVKFNHTTVQLYGRILHIWLPMPVGSRSISEVPWF